MRLVEAFGIWLWKFIKTRGFTLLGFLTCYGLVSFIVVPAQAQLVKPASCGLTIITHGFQPPAPYGNGALPGWVREMADAINERLETPVPIYRVRYDKALDLLLSFDDVVRLEDGASEIDITQNGGAIVLLDWVGASNEYLDYPTQDIAAKFFDFLFSQRHKGHFLHEIPIHLIGHSRGASLNSALAYLLAYNGIIVDQVTTIDPHPVVGATANDWPGSSTLKTYSNTLFADNYYRTLNSSLTNPTGNPVLGAFEIELDNIITGGKEHEKAHTYYHGTVDCSVFLQVDGQYVQDAWYAVTERREETGFNYSRYGGQLRPKKGIHESLSGASGSGVRTIVDSSYQLWPNAGFDQRSPIQSNVTVGQTTGIPYYFSDRASQQTVIVFIDSDTNPYNGTERELGSAIQSSLPGVGVGLDVISWTPIASDTGRHFVGIKTTNVRTDLARVRFDYYLAPVTVEREPSSLVATGVSSSQINLYWTRNSSSQTGFKIERAASSSGPWTLVATAGASAVAYSDTGRTANTTYYYRIRAFNAVGGDSDPSNVASAKTLVAASTARTLTLNSSSPASGAYIYLSTDKSGLADATTPATRSYVANKVVTLVASATAGGNAFQKWQRDGADFSFTTAAFVTMDTDHTMTAVYGTSPSTRTLTALTINGPDSLNENSAQTYTAAATFSDGSVTTVSPQWSLSQNGVPASISQGGVLDAGAVNANSIAYVQAAYTSNGVTKNATKSVTIVDGVSSPVYTLGLSVTGLGAIGRAPNQNQFQSGATVFLTAVPEAYYRFTGWGGDAAASGTTNPITVMMNGNKSISANFVYDAAYFGSVHVTVQPQGAALAGGQWRLDNGPWQNSGATVTPSSNGSHYVFFSNVTGYSTPAMQAVSVTSGQTKEITGSYVAQFGPGALQVTLLPQGAVDAGAQWRIQGGAAVWQNSGATLQGVAAGTYVIEFKAATDWSLPSAQSVTVSDGGTAVVSASYGPATIVPVIYSIGPKTGPILGGTDVTIDGANFIAPVSVTFGGVSTTNVTVESSSRIVARTPASAAYRTVPVVVTAPGGGATVTNGFTYIVPRGEHMDLIGQLGGWAQTLAVQGNYLYLGEGSGFVVNNISNPASPTPVGRLALPGLVRDIAVLGNYAYVAAADAGFFIVDISVPASPTVKGFYDTPGEASGIAFQNGFAYLGDGSGGLIIFDCSDPSAPTVRGSLALPGQSNRVALMTQASKLYACIAAMGPGMHTVEVTDPAAPVLKSTFNPDGDAWDVAISGTRALVANFFGSDTVSIVELANPAVPSLTGHYVNGSASALAVSGSTAYVGMSSGLQTLNIANLASPQFLGSSTSSGLSRKIAIAGNYAYVAEGDNGWRIVSIASSASPTQVAKPPGLFSVQDLTNNGSTLYAACTNSGFNVIDASNPALLSTTGRLDFAGYNCAAVANSGTTVFLSTQGGGGGAGIAVIRTDLATPQLLSTYIQSPNSNRLFCDSALLYAADADINVVPYKARFLTLNFSNLSALSVQSQLTNSNAEGMAYRAIRNGNRGYFSDADGVHVVDFTSSSNPVRMGDIVTPGNPVGLAVANNGSHLLVANGSLPGGISVIDVQNGNQPALINTVLSGTAVGDVLVVGNLAYAACYTAGVYVLDISDVANPVICARYDTAGSAKTLRVQGDIIYVAEQSGGLVALRLLDFLAPTIAITSPGSSASVATSNSTITVSGTATDDKGVSSVTWANSRAGGGTATGTTNWQVASIPLFSGTNILTFTAADSAGNVTSLTCTVNCTPIDTTPPVVNVSYPTTAGSAVTNSTILELRGTADDNQGVASVSWTNNRGGSGVATGTATWVAASIPLLEGPNVVTVTAIDGTGNTGSGTITVNYATPDLLAPTVVLSFPTMNSSYETRDALLNISGTAADNRGVAKVTWTNSRGGTGMADGTTLWSANGLVLGSGLNIITVTAEDESGNSSQDDLAVNYVPLVPPTITSGLPAAGQFGQYYAYSFTATGDPLPTFVVVSGVLPPGLTLTTAGLISGVPTQAGSYTFTVQAANGTNPVATQSTTLVVAKATPVITWATPAAITYGAALSATQLNATANVAGTFVYSPAAGAVLNAGTPMLTATFTPTDATNYTPASPQQTLTVSKAPLTVAAANKTRTYGSANPSFTASYSGFVNGETATVVSGLAVFTTTATSASGVGTYVITPSIGTLAAGNYSFATFTTGALTVTKAPLTVAADNKSKTPGSANPLLTMTYAGFVNGDTANSLTAKPTATTTALQNSPVGTYAITAAGGVSPNYSFTYIAGVLSVTTTIISPSNAIITITIE